jgi:hypothetical protein
MMEIFVAGKTAAYEYDCTGASHKKHLRIGSFRSELDARRVVKPTSVTRVTRRRGPRFRVGQAIRRGSSAWTSFRPSQSQRWVGLALVSVDQGRLWLNADEWITA